MRTTLRASSGRARAFVAILGVAAISIVILACGGGSAANAGTSTSDNSGNQPTTSSQHFKVGSQVKVGDTYVVTINSVKSNSGTDIDKPKSGDTYLVVDMTVKNVSSQEQTLSTLLQFTLKDATGQKYDETITSFTTPPDGKIEPGDQVRGQIPYEVSISQHHFTLAFQADLTSDGETIWDLTM